MHLSLNYSIYRTVATSLLLMAGLLATAQIPGQDWAKIYGGLTITETREDTIQLVGDRTYEYSNHLGNVLATVSDRIVLEVGVGGHPVGAMAEVHSSHDYYPFGMSMAGRKDRLGSYRYGFNGVEHDDEVSGEGATYDTYHRRYDPRIGRWLSQDPITHPFQSPYAAMEGNPILYADPMGSEVQFADEDAKKRYDSYREQVKGGIARVERKIKHNEANSNNPEWAADYQERLSVWRGIDAELDALEGADQVYEINLDHRSKTSRAQLAYDFERSVVKVNLDRTQMLPNDQMDDISHELKHAYQFHTGQLAFWFGSDDKTKHRGAAYDLMDEVDAFNRGEFVSRAGLPQKNFTIEEIAALKGYSKLPAGPLSIYDKDPILKVNGKVYSPIEFANESFQPGIINEIRLNEPAAKPEEQPKTP